MNQLPERVILIGPSGSGKSDVSARLAAAIGYTPVDTDAAIVEQIGMPIAEFFERFGEPAFRAIESSVIADACGRSRVVVATGGGAVLSPSNWEAWRAGSVIIALTARPETLVARVRDQSLTQGRAAERPLLTGNAVERLRALVAARAHLYEAADAAIDTDRLSPDEVSERALEIVHGAAARLMIPALSLATASGRSDVYIQRGAVDHVPAVIGRRWPTARRIWIITDEHVGRLWEAPLRQTLVSADLDARTLVVPPGESSKDLDVVARLCDEMTCSGVTRRDLVVALGGGVIGDLAGFVASVCLRGLPLMQAPTSLLAMVDSSIGGKTGVNMPAGKNLVGTFYQPGVVVVDPAFLSTLPRKEYRSGMAEVIKHSLIQPSTPLGGSTLAEVLEAAHLDPIPDDLIERVLALNLAIKHSVVKADERESGLRMILNFGHTAGHAMEAEGYRYRHGEAVGLGMIVASRIAQALGRVDEAYLERVEGLLAQTGLPVRYDGVASDVIARLSRDKKNVDGTLHWILPKDEGGAAPVTGIPADIVRRALEETGAA